ncbi:MAG TPA: RNA polymerase sigma factor [Streptosporangiaceae bacterium]|nr:RNA polymerase sigma factor [Streptosporangiaceae bacterium]
MGADTQDGYLVQRAQEGYLDAYAELVDRHGGLAYRVALRLVGNHDDAEDVAQEALVAAWQQLPGFEAKSSYSTWLYQIVTRRALNRITRTRTDESLDLLGDVAAPAAEEPARDVERDLTVDAVTAAVADLPPPQRVAIVLHHFEGLPNQEIARITGSTVPAVRSHLFRGRRTLTRTLQEWRLTNSDDRPWPASRRCPVPARQRGLAPRLRGRRR